MTFRNDRLRVDSFSDSAAFALVWHTGFFGDNPDCIVASLLVFRALAIDANAFGICLVCLDCFDYNSAAL